MLDDNLGSETEYGSHRLNINNLYVKVLPIDSRTATSLKSMKIQFDSWINWIKINPSENAWNENFVLKTLWYVLCYVVLSSMCMLLQRNNVFVNN